MSLNKGKADPNRVQRGGRHALNVAENRVRMKKRSFYPLRIPQIGALIRQVRLGQGISQRELAKGAGLTEECIRNVESGKRYSHMRTLAKIARTLGCEIRLAFVVCEQEKHEV